MAQAHAVQDRLYEAEGVHLPLTRPAALDLETVVAQQSLQAGRSEVEDVAGKIEVEPALTTEAGLRGAVVRYGDQERAAGLECLRAGLKRDVGFGQMLEHVPDGNQVKGSIRITPRGYLARINR